MSTRAPQKTPLVFYRSGAGSESVREWLEVWMSSIGQRSAGTWMRAQWRWPVAMPLCRPMGQGLWEVRTDCRGRVLICLDDGVLVALHGFIKKTQKTPDAELAVARKRMKELMS